MAFCKNCGNEMDDLAVVCVKCGTRLPRRATCTPACRRNDGARHRPLRRAFRQR